MATFNVLTRAEVSANKQATFDNLKKNVSFLPNLYAAYAYSDTALGDYLAFQGRKTSLSTKEKEIVIGDKIISNFIHGTTQVPVDFPVAPALEPAAV